MFAIKSVLPFSNEVANVLTSSGFAIFSGLYKDAPKTNKQKLSKITFDLIALVGIILNAVQVTAKHGATAGLIKGIVIIIIAFVIPNLTFHAIIEKICKRCNHLTKLFFGLFLIGLLTGFEFLFDRYILELFHEEKEEEHETFVDGETEEEIAAKEEEANN